jgi:hypothetical protein
MKLDEILDLWEIDSHVDRTELGNEALKIPKLHHKYYKIFVQERVVLKKMELDLKQLKLKKFEFYSQGPDSETPTHWKLPPIGKVIKADVLQYVDTDPDTIAMTLKFGVQSEKAELLESIIKSLSNRGYQISSAIQWEKFKIGA